MRTQFYATDLFSGDLLSLLAAKEDYVDCTNSAWPAAATLGGSRRGSTILLARCSTLGLSGNFQCRISQVLFAVTEIFSDSTPVKHHARTFGEDS